MCQVLKKNDELIEKLKKHAKIAEDFKVTQLKKLVAVKSPNGGYRMMIKIIK
jgi:hypothetical protein